MLGCLREISGLSPIALNACYQVEWFHDRFLGGVCAGIARYLGWDLILVRLLFIATLPLPGSGIMLYLILWFVMPADDEGVAYPSDIPVTADAPH